MWHLRVQQFHGDSFPLTFYILSIRFHIIISSGLLRLATTPSSGCIFLTLELRLPHKCSWNRGKGWGHEDSAVQSCPDTTAEAWTQVCQLRTSGVGLWPDFPPGFETGLGHRSQASISRGSLHWWAAGSFMDTMATDQEAGKSWNRWKAGLAVDGVALSGEPRTQRSHACSQLNLCPVYG